MAALEHLKERLQTEPEPPEIIRKSIAYSLGQIGEPASSDILIDLAIDDSSIDVRTQAITSLGEIAPFDALEELTRLATDIDGTPADVRGNAVGALGEMGYMEAIDATIEAIDDPVVAIQRAAIEAAAEIGGDKAIQKLVSVLDEDAAYPVPVRAKAASDLRYFEDRKVVGALIDILENEEPRIQRSAAISLGRIGDSYATEPLISIVSDSGYDTELRRVAVWALGVISDPESESVLLDVIRDEREPFDIKGRAMLGLGGLGTSTSQRHLEEISTNEEMTQRTRMAAQAVLSQSPSRSIDELKEKVDEGDW